MTRTIHIGAGVHADAETMLAHQRERIKQLEADRAELLTALKAVRDAYDGTGPWAAVPHQWAERIVLIAGYGMPWSANIRPTIDLVEARS